MICIGVMMCMIFMISLKFMKTTDRLTQIEYDLNTITANYYTLQINIDDNAHEVFKNEHYNP